MAREDDEQLCLPKSVNNKMKGERVISTVEHGIVNVLRQSPWKNMMEVA